MYTKVLLIGRFDNSSIIWIEEPWATRCCSDNTPPIIYKRIFNYLVNDEFLSVCHCLHTQTFLNQEGYHTEDFPGFHGIGSRQVQRCWEMIALSLAYNDSEEIWTVGLDLESSTAANP